ncbi:unnamed protein product [Didymodactylos carnosus]|uniref:Uncharacterized protein n=1 Tax=Didymodactylos carnosus TaxID=1234261 RepID=A0A815IKG9_9BILA|nr:unnamed protein product [Didymodactylos carnosus]CAF4250219.1 unnamed protein product [Didymodactylos carnosus]
MLTISDNRWVLLLFFGLSTIQVGLKAINIPECFRDVSGIYLRKFHGANDYAILFFFPLGGVLQVDSAAKLNASQYFSDQAGFYTCKKQLDKAVLSFHGQYFDESGNMSTGLSEAVVTLVSRLDPSLSSKQSLSSNLVPIKPQKKRSLQKRKKDLIMKREKQRRRQYKFEVIRRDIHQFFTYTRVKQLL